MNAGTAFLRSVRALPTLVLLFFSMASCDGGRSTPTSPSSFPRSSGPFFLGGTWQGTVTVTYGPIDPEPPCVDTTSATVEQVGSDLVGTVSQGERCFSESPIRFEGRIDGDLVVGRVYLTEYVWPASGLASPEGFWIEAFNVRWDFHR